MKAEEIAEMMFFDENDPLRWPARSLAVAAIKALVAAETAGYRRALDEIGRINSCTDGRNAARGEIKRLVDEALKDDGV